MDLVKALQHIERSTGEEIKLLSRKVGPDDDNAPYVLPPATLVPPVGPGDTRKGPICPRTYNLDDSATYPPEICHLRQPEPYRGVNVQVDDKYAYVEKEDHKTFEVLWASLRGSEQELALKIQEQLQADISYDPECGNWQEGYTKLHQDILAGRAPQRYVTFTATKGSNSGGLADRLLGMASTFLFALLDNRAFLAEWQEPVPVEAVFDSPRIHWSYNASDARLHDEEARNVYWINKNGVHALRMFLNKDWAETYPEDFLKFQTNRGIMFHMFQSKRRGNKLYRLGLRPANIFSCIIDYLVRPVPSVLSFISRYSALLRLPTVFSVGIQIRTGDTALRRPFLDAHLLADYSPFFECADQIARTHSRPDQRVVYYLVTDSAKLREQAIEAYQDRILVTGLPIRHIHARNAQLDHVADAVIENYILASTDYKVISLGGYGKVS